MEKSPLTWDYLESGFAREVSGTCQPKHWEAAVITIIRRPHFSEKSIPHVTLGLIKILPVFNNPFEKAFSLMFSLHHLESRVS